MQSKKNLIIIVLAVVCCVLAGSLIGVLVSRSSGESASAEKEQVLEEQTHEVLMAEESEVAQEAKEEKTYGYYPSFYVKTQWYTVSSEDQDHTIYVYTDGTNKVKKAWTDCKWLEEEKLEKGGNYFHVKANKDRDQRKGKLFLQDEKGRKITIYVTQRGR